MAEARGLIDDRSSIEVDLNMLEFAEHLLGPAIGPASSRLIVGPSAGAQFALITQCCAAAR